MSHTNRQLLPPFATEVAVRRAVASVPMPRIQADFESARDTADNLNLWARADHLSADAGMSVAVRRKLRNRCRYEVANNAYLKGAQLTLSNDTIGVGPSLQMNVRAATPGDGIARAEADAGLDDKNAKRVNSFIEDDFDEWAREVRLAEKMRTARASRFESGESFLMFVYNPRLRHPVKLDVAVIEADQIADPVFTASGSGVDPRWNDGILHDEWGNPISYRLLRFHPGGTAAWMMGGLSPNDYQDVAAEYVYHDFRRDRPGQTRGIPEPAPALQVCAEVRRFTAAVLDASEWAARASGAVKMPVPVDDGTSTVTVGPDGEPVSVGPSTMDTIELPRRMAVMLPPGAELQQTKAEQPVTTYGDFLYKKLGEIGRCINFPLTMMNLDSSTSNLSARYLDVQPYVRDRQMEREGYNGFLDRLFDKFMTEAIRIPGYLPPETASVSRFPHEWVWPELGKHADPDKVASAQGQELKNGTTTLPDIYSTRGENWERKQEAAAKSLGLTVDDYRKALRVSIFGVDPTAPAPQTAQNTPK